MDLSKKTILGREKVSLFKVFFNDSSVSLIGDLLVPICLDLSSVTSH